MLIYWINTWLKRHQQTFIKSMLSISPGCQSEPVFRNPQLMYLNLIGRNLWISLGWHHIYHMEVLRVELPYHTAFSERIMAHISERVKLNKYITRQLCWPSRHSAFWRLSYFSILISISLLIYFACENFFLKWYSHDLSLLTVNPQLKQAPLKWNMFIHNLIFC